MQHAIYPVPVHISAQWVPPDAAAIFAVCLHHNMSSPNVRTRFIRSYVSGTSEKTFLRKFVLGCAISDDGMEKNNTENAFLHPGNYYDR